MQQNKILANCKRDDDVSPLCFLFYPQAREMQKNIFLNSRTSCSISCTMSIFLYVTQFSEKPQVFPMDLKARAKQLKTDIPAVFLALRHKNTPFAAKAIAFLTVAYALSPIDLIPDFIPVLGYLDDVILLPAMVAWTVKLIPEQVMGECRAQAQTIWKDGKPKRWYYAVPIVVIWLVVLLFVARFVLNALK